MAATLARIERLERLVGDLAEAIRTQEQFRTTSYFDDDEPVALPVTAARDNVHEFKEKPVKLLYLYAQGNAMRVGLNRATSGESFIVPSGAFLSVPRLTKRVYGRTLIGTGTLYLWGFY